MRKNTEGIDISQKPEISQRRVTEVFQLDCWNHCVRSEENTFEGNKCD
jgi:hypothetical protein